MKTTKNVLRAMAAAAIIAIFFINISIAQTTPTIFIDGVEGLANTFSTSPYWLNAGQSLATGNKVNSISVLQYNIAPAQAGGNSLQFEAVLSVTTLQSVPTGKAWKIESVSLDKTAVLSTGGDNWGSQVALTSAELSGNGSGSSPLGIAQQGAITGQSLQWNGSTWQPTNPVNTNVTLTGTGTVASPLSIAQQGATTTQVLTWNGSQWAPATPSAGFTHYLGEFFNGGMVVAVWKEAGVEKGLIIALTEGTSLKWQNTATTTNATSYWDGVSNTNLMTNSPAKTYVQGLGSGWYVPALDEIRFLWQERFFINKALATGGYTLLSGTANYWSSTEASSSDAWAFLFDGSVTKTNTNPGKVGTANVRAVKAF